MSSGVVIATVISFSWKVQPFWVSKFIANKVKVSFSSEAIRHQSAKQKKINVMDGGGGGGAGASGARAIPFLSPEGTFLGQMFARLEFRTLCREKFVQQ